MFRRNESRLASKISLTLVFALLFSGTILTSHTTSANDTHVDDVSIIVPISCNLVGTNTTHSATINPGTTTEDIGKTTLKAFCNDNNGFAIYAIGYTNDTNGTTTLVGDDTDLTIPTSTNTSGSSSWSMKLSKETNSSQAYQPNNLTIVSPYTNYAVVPTNWTKVATFSSATDNTLGAVLYTTYKVHIASGQAADSYNGKVKYTLFHPSTSCLYYTVKFNPGDGTGAMVDQPICSNGSTALSTNTFTPPAGYEFKEWNTKQDGTGTSYSNEQIINTNLADIGESITLYAMWRIPPLLYNAVANQVKTYGGSPQTQTLTDMQAVITEPTSSNPATDTSNSGVFLYNSSVFGAASDASNEYNIYYYRGILDSAFTSNHYHDGDYYDIGSSGNGAYYPNYVKLGNNTCWRIIRTTGSGGIKMIYNGVWSDNTCARADTNAATGTPKYNTIGTTVMAGVGYTYNSSAISNSTFPLGTILGSDSNPTINNTRSTVKTYLEDTWYADNMTDYTNILEPSAGYCNDRTVYDESGVLQNESITTKGSGSSTVTHIFGPSHRYENLKTFTLNCPRNTVDLYRYVSGSTGVGNELKNPIALPTLDELIMAAASGSAFKYPRYSLNHKIYLYSGGVYYWTMSPGRRDGSSGYAGVYVPQFDGMYSQTINYSGNVMIRPVVSLIHSTTIASGSGTATDPWLIDE